MGILGKTAVPAKQKNTSSNEKTKSQKYTNKRKHDFGISFFFVCYVSDEVVSFSDSIPMRNIA